MEKLADISAFEALSSQNCSINNGLFDPVKKVWDKGVDAVTKRIAKHVVEEQRQRELADRKALKTRQKQKDEEILRQIEEKKSKAINCDKEAKALIREAVDSYDQMCKKVRTIGNLPEPIYPMSIKERLDKLREIRPFDYGRVYDGIADRYYDNYNDHLAGLLWKVYDTHKERIQHQWDVDYSETKYNPVSVGLGKLLRKVIPGKKVDNSRTYHRNKVSLVNRGFGGFGGFDLGSRGGDVRERKHLDEGIESRHLSDEKQPVHGGTQKELHDKYIRKVTPVDGKYGKWASEIPVSDDDQQKARALLRECKSRVLRAVNGVDDTAPPENPANGEEEHIKQGDWVGFAKAAGIDIGKLLGKNY